jgi:FkbM family methyltransferase
MQRRHGVKIINGLRWPEYDTQCAAVVFDSIPDLERAISFCRNKRTVIQAGGNCGVWARHLSTVFKRVWTWEPDELNYHCLAHNTMPMKNVFCVLAALGEKPGYGLMIEPEPQNCGALQVLTSGIDAGKFSIEALDSYGNDQLGIVDLIYLDLEGFELSAIKGAMKLIQRCQPVIAVEDKGLSERYGVAQGDVVRYIEETFNYEVCDRYARDIVLRPRARSTTQGSAG